VKFWDSSALAPCFLEESATPRIQLLLQDDPEVVVWCLTRVEIISAIGRRSRENPLQAPQLLKLRDEVLSKFSRWAAVSEINLVREHAERLLLAHPLRAADALQLGAAIVAAENQPATLEFVTLDRRLGAAAAREGFPVLGVI